MTFHLHTVSDFPRKCSTQLFSLDHLATQEQTNPLGLSDRPDDTWMDGEPPVTSHGRDNVFLICKAMGEYPKKHKHISKMPSLKASFQRLPWFYGSFQVGLPNRQKTCKNMVMLHNPLKFFFCGIV